MGIYTNHVNGYYASSDYRDVEPYHGEHFNYQELGIIAAAESTANQNSFMKAIALNELASVEQYGTEEVFYEAVNIKGIFERIKAFFKKIIEKINKIFHTFIAKMSSWFGNSKNFANKYEKEIIKNWGLVKNDWEIKGWKFTNIITDLSKDSAKSDQTKITSSKNNDPVVNALKASDDAQKFADALATMAGLSDITGSTKNAGTVTSWSKNNNDPVVIYQHKTDSNKYAVRLSAAAVNSIKADNQNLSNVETGKYYDFAELSAGQQASAVEVDKNDYILATSTVTQTKIDQLIAKFKLGADGKIDNEAFTKFREDFNEKGKDQIRHTIVESFKNKSFIVDSIDIDFSHNGAYDAKEFTEELTKAVYGEDGDKEDINKSDIEKMYGGSITSMITLLKDYDKIKTSIEKSEKDLIASIDKKIKAIDKAQDVIIKDKDTKNANLNQSVIQVSTVFQSFWGFIKECETQVFSTYLQGLKDACSQAKQIAVAVIGLNKKMTESYDYSNSYYSDNSFNSFIENVKLV
jgi:hypothetical protein